MRYKFLGGSGILVSELSLGTMTFGDGGGFIKGNVGADLAFDLMKMAFEHGVNFYDCAEGYGGPGGVSERIFGEAIKRGIDHGVWERKDLVISTKLFSGTRAPSKNPNIQGLSRKHLIEGTIESLKRMQLDYVDLLFCHRPDPSTKIEETVRTMNSLIQRGMILYWGTSEWSATQLQKAIGYAEKFGLEPPLFDQCQYSLIARERVEREYVSLYPDLGLTVWGPMAGGALTGKYKKGEEPKADTRFGKVEGPMKQRMIARLMPSLEVAHKIEPFAKELGCTLAQLAMAWCMANPNVSTAICGASSCEQLKETLGSLSVVAKLTPEVMKRIDDAAGTSPPWDEITSQVRMSRQERPAPHARL